MRRLTIFLTILILASCLGQSDPTNNNARRREKFKNTFASCFAGIDTSKVGKSVGCSGGTFKLINDKYVICILPDFPVQFDSCYRITIDSTNAESLTELLIFDNDSANLTNICTDVIITNIASPTRQLSAQGGQLIIGFSDPTEYYGNQTYHTTILVKKLVFIDNNTGEKIELRNELLWKVLNTGIPG